MGIILFKMIACIVFVVCQILTSVSVYGQSQHPGDFENRVTEAVRKVINFERIEHLERNVETLHRKSEAQEIRINNLESEKLEHENLIQQLLSELRILKRKFHATTNTANLSVPEDHQNQLRNAQVVDIHKHKVPTGKPSIYHANNTSDQLNNNKRSDGPQNRIRRGNDETVAFSVYLGQSVESLSPGTIVRCSNVILNSGHAYNPQTGVFTAPFEGIYLFDYHFDSAKHTVLALFIDGANQLDAVSFPAASREGMAGNLIIVELKAGQQVWLEGRIIAEGMVIGDGSFRYTTFSGMLVY